MRVRWLRITTCEGAVAADNVDEANNISPSTCMCAAHQMLYGIVAEIIGTVILSITSHIWHVQ